MKAWIDGNLTDASEARVPLLDHGLLYGDGVFEGIRIASRRIFRLPDHLVRLRLSAKAIGLHLPWDDLFITKALQETARAHGSDEAYARLIVTRGQGALGVDPKSCPQPSLIAIVGDIALFPPDKAAAGITLATSSLRRPGFDTVDPRVKSLNYLNNVLARAEANRHGADDALVLNGQGRVAEASVANIFAVLGGTLTTPPTSEAALAGITRQSVLELARDAGVPAAESPMTRADLFAASEVFITGSGAGLVPIASLDGQPLGSPERPITTQLTAALQSLRQTRGTPF